MIRFSDSHDQFDAIRRRDACNASSSRTRRRRREYPTLILRSVLSIRLLRVIILSCLKAPTTTLGVAEIIHLEDRTPPTGEVQKGFYDKYNNNNNNHEQQTPPIVEEDNKDNESLLSLNVVTLTSRNFDHSIRRENKHHNKKNNVVVWLIEFYAPWCVQCIQFAPTYAVIAAYFHGQATETDTQSTTTNTAVNHPKVHVRVAKVDGDAERALSTRFRIQSFPSFFLIDSSTRAVYKIHHELVRSLSSKTAHFIQFIESGEYQRIQKPLPFYASPLGPLGMLQGSLMNVGAEIIDQLDAIEQSYGFSPVVAGGFMMATMFAGCFCIIVLITITCVIHNNNNNNNNNDRKAKED